MILKNSRKSKLIMGIHDNRHEYLTIIPRAQMGCESIAHEAEGSEAMRARGIIVLVNSN